MLYSYSQEKTEQEKDIIKSAQLDFRKTQAVVQSERKAALRGTCARRGLTSPEGLAVYTERHIYVVDKYKVMYCFVPKVGCSNWKRILMVLNGERESVEGLTSDEVHLHAKMRLFNSYTPGQQENMLKNYRKFVFVRGPLKRVLSVYRNKFEDVAYYRGNKFFHPFGKQIIRKFRSKPSKMAVKTGENATWTEFVDYLTHPMERAKVEKDTYFSDHWIEMHKICSPCTINYDVIGHLETVTDDAKFVLDMLKVPDKVQYLSSAVSRPTNSSNSRTFDKYFSQLSEKQLLQLWDLYKLDYELFDYLKPAIIPT